MRKLDIKIERKSVTVLIFLLSAITANAQRLKPDTIIKANKVTLITTRLDDNIFSVSNSDNIYHNRVPKHRNPDMYMELTDNSSMLRAIKQVFSDERLKQLLPERRIFMTMYVNTSGKVMDISFILDKNTSITAQELEALEIAVKANISYKFNPKEINGQDFIDIGFMVRYKNIFDGTLK